MSRALILCCVAGLWTHAAAEAVVRPTANEALLHSARLWESHDRGDLAQLALQKLVAARPDSPEALLELGELDLRLGAYDDAKQVRDRLNERFNGAAAARSFAIAYRIATRDRLAVASIRQLIELRRFAEARTMLDGLFPDGAPGEAFAIDYYDMLGATPGGWQPSYEGLKRLADRHPNDPRYQLALVRHLLRRPPYAREALARLQRVVGRDDVRAAEVDGLLETTLSELGYQGAPSDVVRDYLARHPGDPKILALRRDQEQALDERRLLLPGAWRAVIPAVQRRLAQELASAGGTAQGRQALRWLERSRASMRAQRPDLAAAELRAASAFWRGQYEAEIPIAQDLEARGAPDEARELLAAAGDIDPKSNWLFESRVRWLIEHQRPGEALTLLRARALNAKWTAQARDALVVLALDRRAAAAEAAGDIDAALEDLEAAVALAPRDPWLSYRLANLYTGRHRIERGRELMGAGVRAAPDAADMRYAQALYLASVHDDPAALTAVDSIPSRLRTPEMNALRDRLRVTQACAEARRLKDANDLAGARRVLLAVDPLAAQGIDRAAELAYAWIDAGDAEHGIGLIEAYRRGAAAHDPAVLMLWANVLNSAEDISRLDAALEELRALPDITADQKTQVARLQRALDLRTVRALEREGQFDAAARRLDALLGLDPHDRTLRAARAALYLTSGEPGLARDFYASLVAEEPEDLAMRLEYIRALTESGDLVLARSQLRLVEDEVPPGDGELQLNLARRQFALGDPRAALSTLRELLAAVPARADVLLLAGRAEREQRHFAAARALFARAGQTATGTDAAAARREIESIDERLRAVVTAGVSFRHQPGDPGMSQLDMATLPSAWILPLDYEHRITARADAVSLDAGRSNSDSSLGALLGTIEAAGPTGMQRYANGRQSGMSLGAGYKTDALTLDLGTTPLGFLLSNVVGGVEWTPKWNAADVTLGVSRRAVTNSELSYAGLKDPVSGAVWGGVVQSGPYAGIGLYRDRWGVSGSLQFDELTGTRVLDNQFLGARVGTDWKFLRHPDFSADAGLTLNYWNYQHNLANYTLGSGGYYSPQSYASLAAPLEVNGTAARWTYRLRASISYTVSDSRQAAFYPDDPALQGEAHANLPAGYGAPFFPASHTNAVGYSAFAAGEREISRGLVLGAMIDLDRTDYYHPTTVLLYFRHAFAPWSTPVTSPVQPIRAYNP